MNVHSIQDRKADKNSVSFLFSGQVMITFVYCFEEPNSYMWLQFSVFEYNYDFTPALFMH